VRHTIGAPVLLAMAMTLVVGAAFAQGKPAKQAETLFEWANQERADQGLPKLRWDEALAAAAQKHAERMAQADLLSHQLAGEPDLDIRGLDAGAHFSLIAENVAEGPDLENIHNSWMLSEPHRENLLNPQVDSVGIAVSVRDGRFFAVQDFSRCVPNLNVGQQEKQFGAILTARRLRLLTNTGDAERACKAGRADSARQRPLAMVWFETTNLSVIPASLERRIQSGHYGWAAVGACPATSTPGFAAYRIAVLLY
jgi:hypothetical protein